MTAATSGSLENGETPSVLNETEAKSSFDSIESTVEAFGELIIPGPNETQLSSLQANGEFVIVLDSTNRENEGDLIVAAQDMTTEKMAFMIRYTSGYICVPVSELRTRQLRLPSMVIENADPYRTAYTVSVDANFPDVTTGISAHDRALTCRTLASSTATPESFRRPGHILPLQGRNGGVRARFGHTEASLELCRLAGKQPAAVICELVKEGTPVPGRPELIGGGMMRRDDCLRFGKQWGLKVCTIEDLVAYVEKLEGPLKDVR